MNAFEELLKLDIIKNYQYLKTLLGFLFEKHMLDIIKNYQYLKTEMAKHYADLLLDIIKNYQYLKTANVTSDIKK